MKISVCIPTYNQASFIENAVKSAFVQSRVPDEIIVSDDSSTDETYQILKELSKDMPVLRIVRQPLNVGMDANTDAVLRQATGDYIVKLDSDDYLHPLYVEKLVRLMDKYPDAAYAHAAVQEVDENGRFTRTRHLARKQEYYSGDKALKRAIKGYQVAANIIMFRKTALQDVGYITSKTNFAYDYYLSAQLASAGYGNVYLGEILSYYRVWTDEGKLRQRRKLDEIRSLNKVFEEILKPAFKSRQWSLSRLEACKVRFACQQADCLGWGVYSQTEKQELAAALSTLSSNPRAKLVAALYMRNLGKVVKLSSMIFSLPKFLLKKIYLELSH